MQVIRISDLEKTRRFFKMTNFPSFHGLWIGTQSLVRLTLLYGTAPPPVPHPPNNPVPERGREES